MRLQGKTRAEILKYFIDNYPDFSDATARVDEIIPFFKRSIWPEQAGVLFALAKQYNYEGARILEIGSGIGYSGAHIALGAPKAQITTLNPKGWESKVGADNLKAFPNIRLLPEFSWEYLERYTGPELDMVFIDGDHKQVERDMPWWDWLKVGGLMVHHDYSPDTAKRPVQHVYNVLNNWGAELERDFDVLVQDENLDGMAGWYRREGEAWQIIAQPQS